MQCTVAPQHEDPLFFDREGLEAVASSAVVGEGLRSYKEHRVIAIDQDQGRLWAQVEDEGLELPCTVQIITMVAADSYEEQVFALVSNKQDLFDNVVNEDATEDVVGVSKKLLETPSDLVRSLLDDAAYFVESLAG